MVDKQEVVGQIVSYGGGIPLVLFSWLADPQEVQAIAALIASMTLAAKFGYDVYKNQKKK